MALKFLKNTPLSPTTSSPEKIPHPLATNVRTQNLQPLVSSYSTRTAMTNAGRRGVKRVRDSSGDENSSEEDIVGGRAGSSTAGMAERRKVKRVRTGDHQWTAYHPRVPPRESSSDEYEDEEDETMTPSPVKRTGLNMGGLTLTPPHPVSSEYASMNGLLKMLHLNRGSSDSRGDRSKPGLKELEGKKWQPLRPLAPSTPQKSTRASEQPEDRVVEDREEEEQKEKDSVTSIYEEANRALGRLMLDRRKLARSANMLDIEGSEEDESESESEDD